MPHALRLLTPALLGLVALLYGFGYYGARSILFGHIRDEMGMDFPEVQLALSLGTTWSLIAMALGIVLAFAVGPLPVAATGMGIAAAGWVLIGSAGSPPMLYLGLAMTGLGTGLFRPALVVGATRWFGHGWESARLAAAFGVYGAVNLGALGGPFVAGYVRDAFGNTPIFFAGAGALLLAAIVALVAFAASFSLPVPGGPKSTEAWSPGAIGVGLTTALLGSQAMAVWAFATDQQMMALYSAADVPQWAHLVNPLVVLPVCAVGVIGGVGAQIAGVRIPAHALAGLGMVGVALSLLPSLGFEAGGVGVIVGVFVAGAVGEALMVPALWSAAVGGVHWRLGTLPATAIVAGSSVASLFSTSVSALFNDPTTAGTVATGLAGGLGLAGVVFLAGAWPARIATDRWLALATPSPPTPTDGTAT